MIQQIEMSGQQQKQVKYHDDFQVQIQKSPKPETSPFFNAYHQFFQHYNAPNHQPVQKLSAPFAYLKNQSSQVFSISIIDHTFNFEIVKLKVRLDKFKIEIVLLNFQKKMQQIFPDCYNKSESNEFNFNNVMVNQKLLFFKKFCIQNQNKAQKIMTEAIREYCFLKIAQDLRVGPELATGLKFDAYCFADYFCFGMEMCENYLYNGASNIQKDLMLGLKLLHSYHIVHFDIKPDNIAFSSKWAKFVFIDFGLTDCIEEDIGQLKMMSFRGSLEYCSPQFYSLYLNSNQTNLVDPYYNDCHCLDASLSAIEVEHKKKIGIIADSEGSRYQETMDNSRQINHLIITIKYELFQQNHDSALVMVKLHKCIQIQNELALFLHELYPSPSLRLVYQQIRASIRQALQFRLLSLAYKQLSAFSLSFSQVSIHKKNYNHSKIGFLSHTKSIKTNDYKNIQNIKAIFETPKIRAQNVEIYFEGFLNCVDPTFNRYGLSLHEKTYILWKFYEKFIKEEQDAIITKPLEVFKKCTDFLLAFVLKKPATKWKMDRAFKIFNIAVLIDQYELAQIQLYLNDLKRIFGNKQKEVMFLLQASNIAYWLHFRVQSQKNICVANFVKRLEASMKQTIDQNRFLLSETHKLCFTVSQNLRQRVLCERNIQEEQILRYKLIISGLEDTDVEYAKEFSIVQMCAEILCCSQAYTLKKDQLYNSIGFLTKQNNLFISPLFFLHDYDYNCQKQDIVVRIGIRKMFKTIVSFPQIYQNYTLIYLQNLVSLQPIPSVVMELKQQFWNRWHTKKWMVFSILVEFFCSKRCKSRYQSYVDNIEQLLLEFIQKSIEDSKQYLKICKHTANDLYLSIGSKELLRIDKDYFDSHQNKCKYVQLHDEYIRVFLQVIKLQPKINQKEVWLDYLKHQFMNHLYHQQTEEAVQTLVQIKGECSDMPGPIYEHNMIFYLINTYHLELRKNAKPKQLLLQIYNFSLVQQKGVSVYSQMFQSITIIIQTIYILLEEGGIAKTGQFIVYLCRKALDHQFQFNFKRLFRAFYTIWSKQFEGSYLVLSQYLKPKWPSMQMSKECLLSLFYCCLNSKHLTNLELKHTFMMNEPFIINSLDHLPYRFQQNILYLYLNIKVKISMLKSSRKTKYYMKLRLKVHKYFPYNSKQTTFIKPTKSFPERQKQSLMKIIDKYIKCLIRLADN